MRNNILNKKLFFVCIILFAFVFCLVSLFSFDFSLVKAEKFETNSVGSYEDLESGLFRLFNQFGVTQDGEKIVIDKESVEVENEEEYVSSSALNLDTEISTFSMENNTQELISLSSLEEKYDITEEDDAYVLSKSDYTNRIIVSYDGELEPYNTEYYAEGLGYHIYQYENQEDTKKAFEYYSNLSYVESVEYDYVVTVDTISDYTTLSSSSYLSWGADVTGVADYMAYLDYLFTDEELNTVYVPVLDSGVDTNHNLLKDRIDFEHSKDFTGTGSSENGKYAFEDDNGHGTHTAGIIADQTKDNVKIISLKVLKANGKGSVANILLAFEYIQNLNDSEYMREEFEEDALGIRVINMSLGLEDEDGNIVHSPNLENKVREIYRDNTSTGQNGILSVVAAGNSGRSTMTCSPANVSEAIVVSALSSRNNDEEEKTEVEDLFFASYSNYGSTVDFSAPGTWVVSSYIRVINGIVIDDPNFCCEQSGTSMAAPHVTACIALILSSPTLAEMSNAEIISNLKANSIDLGDEGFDQYYGNGLINISNLGIITKGVVDFSVSELHHTEEFEVELSYDLTLNGGESYTIYYTTDGTEPGINSQVYSAPITISETTQIRAIAYATSQIEENNLIKSKISTITYYLNNIDLDSNFEINQLTGTIVKYNGNLATLNVQDVISNTRITRIGESAFSNSNVENVILPNSCIFIDNYAFYNATNLESITLNNVYYIRNYAFANCINLRELYLPYAMSIGTGAFNNVKLDSMTLGGQVSTFGEMSNFSVGTLECYTGMGLDETYNLYADTIVSINLQVVNVTGTTKLIGKSGDEIVLQYDVYGKFSSPSYRSDDENASIYVDNSEFETKNVRHITFTFSGLSVDSDQPYLYYLNFYDIFGNQIQDNIEITILPSVTQEYALNIEGENFDVYVNGQLVNSGFVLYAGISDYEIKIEAEKGYGLSSINVDGETQTETYFTLPTINGDVTINCVSYEIPNFSIQFSHSENVDILVNETPIEDTITVDRNGNLTFQVQVKEGYRISQVSINGEIVTLDENNSFTLTNVLENFNVEIVDKQITFNLYISYGNGGDVSAANIEQVFYGANKVLDIIPNEGYEVDSVFVNGEEVEVINNQLDLQNITSDMEIVVSFRPINTGLTESELALIILFSILIGATFIWGITELILKIRRDKKYNYKKNYSKHF